MTEQSQKYPILPIASAFIVLPLFLYATNDIPRRTLLKESISILIISSFCLMLAQFFLTRGNSRMLRGFLVRQIITIHKVMGYLLVCILLVHPLLIVLPRYFEAGINAKEALLIMITTFNSSGIVLGITAWSLLFILAITSLFREKLFSNNRLWRKLHAVMSSLFIFLASWHAIDLGRHFTSYLSIYVIFAAICGFFLLIKANIPAPKVKQEVSRL